jgi:hypothetical protein
MNRPIRSAFAWAATIGAALGLILPNLTDAGGGALHAQAVAPPIATAPVRLISQDQYISSITRIFGSDIEIKLRLAPVTRAEGLLRVGASSAVLTGGGLDPLEGSAHAIADQVVSPGRREFLVDCKPSDAKAADARCASMFLARVGRLLYRRPLGRSELADFVAVAGQVTGETRDFYAGISYALAGMLVAPDFLFIRERLEPDPDRPGASRLDGYSKASRLSYLLWNSSPDEALLTAAESGDIHDPAELRRQVDRMIASPLFRDGVRAFFADFLVTEAFDTLTKDSKIYPGLTIKAVGEAREQMLRTIVDHLVTRQGDYRDLFTTRRTFLTADLAQLYRVPVNLGSQGWVPYEFPANSPRAGILTQIGFLAQYAHPGRSSVTRRGRAVRETLLCQHVPDPPPNVDFSKFEDPKAGLKTARERLVSHNENPVCAGCHTITDPIGLPLETFDGAGQFRTMENGVVIDPGGSLNGVDFADAAGLGQALSRDPALKSCIVSRLYAYGTGRKLAQADEEAVSAYTRALDRQDYRFDRILRLVVLDPRFFSIGPAPPIVGKPNITAVTGDANAHHGQ